MTTSFKCLKCGSAGKTRTSTRYPVCCGAVCAPEFVKCATCTATRLASEFSVSGKGRGKRSYLNSRCNPCRRRLEIGGHRTREQYRRAHLKWAYGISLEEYNEKLARQSGVCAICNNVDAGGFDLHVDHSRAKKTIRGLLCGTCNKGLGQFKDDAILLTLAAAYLESYS